MKIKDTWQYTRSHAGQLLWSEVVAVFMPGLKRQGENMDGGLMNNPWVHAVWKVAKPIAYHWMGEVGWQVFKSMFRKKR